jgi:hypothetical protein
MAVLELTQPAAKGTAPAEEAGLPLDITDALVHEVMMEQAGQ